MPRQPATVRPLGPGQIQRLNKRLRDMTNGKEPAHAAAELAEHMRRYHLKTWGGFTLAEIDNRANTMVYCSELYQGGRHWQSSHAPEAWTTGVHLLALYTPSLKQALVLRQSATPSWPDIRAAVGLNILPRHPKHLFSTQVEVHRHALPMATPIWGIASMNWELCCNRSYFEWDVRDEIRQLVDSNAPLAKLRDALATLWLTVHGPATFCWQ